MLIGGIQTLTLLDFPGKVAALIFTAGCNFRCGYCHNPQFVLPEQIKKLAPNFIPEEKFFHFLDTRKGFLDGVVISGGEPTMHEDLPAFCQKIKDRGFFVKLDTNGTNPEVLEKLIEKKLVDFIAMDIKHPLEKYPELVSVSVDPRVLKKSIRLIKKSELDHEFRTTVLSDYHGKAEIEQIAKAVAGAQKFTLQNFRPAKTLNPEFSQCQPCTPEQLQDFKKIAEKHIANVEVLG
ncbi:MAG: anaerobic ribonucleoside-triphosphate reductase activating protein [Candidatus Gracilibacteria bacterium]|nr:anaerobic ribonucleoside-triphosphate reductase activating protein [Candidatus Gracilibacteria bacterium]